MAFDTKKWLVEDLGFSEAEAAELVPRFDGERAKKLEGGFLRQADYSREMNKLKAEVNKQQAELQAANERLNAELADWAAVQAGRQQEVAGQREALHQAQQEQLRLTQLVTTVAEQAGLDPQKVLQGAKVTPPKEEPKTPPIDLNGYVKQDQLAPVIGSLITLPAELQAIADEHFELYGKRLDTRELVKELTTRAGTKGNTKSLDVRTIWEETHGVPQKREEVSKARYDEALKAAEARGYERARTEEALPGQPPPGRSASPVLRGAEGKARESVLQRPQPGTTVRNAVAALRSGKYRVKDGSSGP